MIRIAMNQNIQKITKDMNLVTILSLNNFFYLKIKINNNM
jgi:hypothetical protein